MPGVGAFRNGMNLLKKHSLIDVIHKVVEKKIPILGICLGMQLFFNESFEFGREKGLSLIKGQVKKLPIEGENSFLKIPNIGWNELIIKKKDILLKNIRNNNSTYFVHSYMAVPEDKSSVTSTYKFGNFEIVASVNQENIFGCQFHPEKSGNIGLTILNNFISIKI